MSNVIRILLLGKTGVGKSSFINYFLNRDVAATGVGDPCTQEITKYTLEELDNCTIELYDSKGLEVLDADNWTKNIVSELEKKKSLDFSQRYHTIFYCISAKKKIEVYETETLKSLYRSAGQQIHIILTHCDSADESALQEREDFLRKEISDNLCIYRIISVNKKLRNGTVISQQGREKVLEGVFNLLWSDVAESVAEKTASLCYDKYSELVRGTRWRALAFIDKHFSTVNFVKWIGKLVKDEDNDDLEEAFDDLIERFESDLDVIKESISDESNEYIQQLTQIYNAYTQLAEKKTLINGYDIVEVCSDVVSDVILSVCDADIENYVLDKLTLGKAMKYAEGDCDDVKSILKCLATFTGGVVSLKRDLNSVVEETVAYLMQMVRKNDIKQAIYQKIVNG